MSRTYTTRAGDMFDGIAHTQMGSANYMDLLMEANPEHIYTSRFAAGVVLTIPDVPTPARPASLPPWKVA